jgi:hypothetical protein
MMIRKVPVEDVTWRASLVWELIERAASPTPETPGSLVSLALMDKASFWIAEDDDDKPVAVGFTQILQGPKGRKLSVLAIGGAGGARWLRAARKIVKADAARYGATKFTFSRVGGRKKFMGLEPVGYYYEDMI